MELFESSLLCGTLHQVAPRWKYCVLETERGFHSVLTHLLRERTTHREVRRDCGDHLTRFDYEIIRDQSYKAGMQST